MAGAEGCEGEGGAEAGGCAGYEPRLGHFFLVFWEGIGGRWW